ncbi:MAG: eCIS core domain-containing protein [Caldimonas sp.]
MSGQVLDSPGEALSPALRDRFEPRFGADFSGVRVHRGGAAEDLARALSARAFTVGQHIVFGAGAYAPEASPGQRLLAHELAHTLQQRHAQTVQRLAIGATDDSHERAADAVADAVMRGGTMPVAPSSPLSIQRVQRTTDADVESGSGAGAGITNGTLTTVAGVHGSTFDASNCFGVDGCNVHFTFEKAYKGTYPYGAAGGATVRGLYVKIVARPDDNCWSCNHLEMIQVLRNTTMTAGAMVTAEPNSDMRKQRSGWSDAKAPSRGWRVDATDSERNPFYSQSWVGQSGDFRTPAILWDTPGGWDADRNAGKDFQSCLICVNGSSRISLGCVTWGYYIDTAGAITFQPQPTASCSATTQLRDASKRWDTLPGHQHIDLGSDTPGRPAGETPQPIPPGGSAIG